MSDTLPRRSAQERLDEALANLHLMEPADASKVIERTLEQAMRERIGPRTFTVHGPRR